MKEGLETESAKQGYKRVLGKEARVGCRASLLTACPIKPCSSQGPKLNSYIITARITGVPDLGTQAGILYRAHEFNTRSSDRKHICYVRILKIF